MDLNKIKAEFSNSQNRAPVDRKALEESGENAYSAINIIASRASQISSIFKEKLNKKLEDLAMMAKDNQEDPHLEEKRSEIVSFFERLPKATTIAMEEFLRGKLDYKKLED